MADGRTLFRFPAPGCRYVRGEPIRRLQHGLEANGASPGKIDGIFGRDTRGALAEWRGTGTDETGIVTFDDWQALTGAAAPSLLDRALQLTADFESHGFGKVAGNFDGAYLTWGIIGFTLRHGELTRIFNEIEQRHPEILREAFGGLEAELMAAFNGGPDAQRDFADGISLGQTRYKVEPQWAEAFARLGTYPEVQAIQMEGVGRYWNIALRDADRFALTSELGLALCFDIAVQNGGIDSQTEESSIRARLAQTPPADDASKRALIADVVAENSVPKYVEDVRSRKRTVATGDGEVHGARYRLLDWGLDDVPAELA